MSALHDLIFLLDGSHEAAGKYDANQLKNKTDKQFIKTLQCERFTYLPTLPVFPGSQESQVFYQISRSPS